MYMEEVLKNIYRIPVVLPGNPLREVNSYLIRDPVRSLLIDTGFRIPECKDALFSGLDELGVKSGSFDVFLTHMHADHSGLSSDLVSNDQRIYVSETDGKLLEKLPRKGEKWDSERWVFGRSKDILAGMPPEIVDNMETLNPALLFAPSSGAKYTFVGNGDNIAVGGYSLRCISTPGHSPGHTCLWDEQAGLFFSGDHVLFDITPNITAWPDVEDSLGDYLNSLQAVRELPVKTTLPGHRKPGDFHMRIDELFEHHKRRLSEVERILRENPGLTAYEISGRMKWRIRAVDWNDFPAPQKIFAVGECLSHLNYLRFRGLVDRKKDGSVYRFFGIRDWSELE